MLIAIRNIRHDGIDYLKEEEVPAEVMTPEQKELLFESGALKEFKTRAEAMQTEELPAAVVAVNEEPAMEVAPETPVEAAAEVVDGTPNVNWTKQRLLDFASQNNITVSPDMTRSELMAIIAPEAPVEVAPEAPVTPQE